MKDPAVAYFSEKRPYWKISVAQKDKRFPNYSWVTDEVSLKDEFECYEDDEEVRITKVYLTPKEYDELKEFTGP